MTVRYDKLWSLMKTNKMKKSELAKAAGIQSKHVTVCTGTGCGRK